MAVLGLQLIWASAVLQTPPGSTERTSLHPKRKAYSWSASHSHPPSPRLLWRVGSPWWGWKRGKKKATQNWRLPKGTPRGEPGCDFPVWCLTISCCSLLQHPFILTFSGLPHFFSLNIFFFSPFSLFWWSLYLLFLLFIFNPCRWSYFIPTASPL